MLASLPLQTQDPRDRARALVEELRVIAAPIGPPIRSDGRRIPIEERRRVVYRELRLLRHHALPPLAKALQDEEVHLRRGAALALNVLSGPWWDRPVQNHPEPGATPLDIFPILPSLVAALNDPDEAVGAWSAQALGNIGPPAVAAVPHLTRLLRQPSAERRIGACIALRGIGPMARAALPSLRTLTRDADKDVRHFATLAITSIDGPPPR